MRQYSALLDDRDRQVVVRNSSHREEVIMTAAGELNAKVPRVRERRKGDVEKAQFRSSIFPLYLRRVDRICTLSQNEKERMTRLNYAVAIDRLLADPELREQMRAKNFSWEKSAGRLLQVCREVVG